MFLQVDTSNDGFLSLDEIKQGMGKVLGSLQADSQDWIDLVEQLDTNGDGKIDYSEFITAAVNRARLLNSQNLEIAFKMFDVDGNGKISKDELRSVFHGGNEEDEALWQGIIEEVDRDNDQMISHDEFLLAMEEVITHRSSNLNK